MNKRGVELLGKNLVSIIIAIIGIVLIIIVLGIFLRGYFNEIKNIEKAKGTLEYFLEETKQIRVGESKKITIMVPAGWHFVCFEETTNQNKQGFEKPAAFFSKKALCICKSKKCYEKTCKEIDKLFKQGEEMLFLKIKLMDLNVTNKETHYEVSVIK